MYIRYTDFLVFSDNLNVQNCVNSTKNCVHYMYRLPGFTKKCDLYRYVECIELRKSNENCVH